MQRLEVEEKDQDSLLLITETSHGKSPIRLEECVSPADATKPLKRTNIPPPLNHSLMQRLQEFIPKLREANHELLQRRSVEYSLEEQQVVEGTPHIDLKLGMGVFAADTSKQRAITTPEEYEMALLASLMNSETEESDGESPSYSDESNSESECKISEEA